MGKLLPWPTTGLREWTCEPLMELCILLKFASGLRILPAVI
jgi:hypothetical protein